jgi:hypothetical protein
MRRTKQARHFGAQRLLNLSCPTLRKGAALCPMSFVRCETRDSGRAGPIQARYWLEWGMFTAGAPFVGLSAHGWGSVITDLDRR